MRYVYTPGMIRIARTATLGEAARIMEREDATALVVVGDDDEPIGVIADRHLLAAVAASRHPDLGTVGTWMAPVVIDEDGARTLPDTDASRRVGIRTGTRSAA